MNPVTPEMGRVQNSPWNIATDFEIDMSFNPEEIKTMLVDYEKDYQTGMDINLMANEIYKYTSGYPVLVSRICKMIHERLDAVWTKESVVEIVKIMTRTQLDKPLFDDVVKNLKNNDSVRKLMERILLENKKVSYVVGNTAMELCLRYAFLKIEDGLLKVSNKIFEILISQYLATEALEENTFGEYENPRDEVVAGGRFHIELFFEKFRKHYKKVAPKKDEKYERFIEKHGTLLFLSFLQPYLNGRGHYYLESQTSIGKRLDVVINYAGEEFIVELKLWYGDVKQDDGRQQLLEYMAVLEQDKGYLLTFDFRTRDFKESAEWIEYEGKKIYEIYI
jgi:hypothetical protein